MTKLGLRQLDAFRTLAGELHFGRAAEALGTSQPHLSQIIRTIEDRLDLRLFERRPRVRLTPAGAALLDSVQRALDELDYGVGRARRLTKDSDSVVLGLASTALLGSVRAVLRSFATHGRYRLQIREMHSNEHVEGLRAGVIDLGLTRNVPAAESFEWRCVAVEDLVAVVPASHRLAGQSHLDVAELADASFVLFRPAVSGQLHRKILSICSQCGFSPNIVHEVDEWHTILGLVGLNLGVSIAPIGVSGLRLDGVAFVPISNPDRSVALYLCWPGEGLSAGATMLRDALVAVAPPAPE